MKNLYTWLAESIISRPFAAAAVIAGVFVLALFGLHPRDHGDRG